MEEVVGAALIASADEVTGPFNIGTGKESSVLDLVEVLGKLGHEMGIGANSRFQAQFAPARAGEVLAPRSTPAKSRDVLGFDARVELEQGIRRTLEWVVAEDSAQLRAKAS